MPSALRLPPCHSEGACARGNPFSFANGEYGLHSRKTAGRFDRRYNLLLLFQFLKMLFQNEVNVL